MKTYPHLFSKLFCTPLLLHEPVRYGLESALLGRMGLAHDDTPRLAAKSPAQSEEPQRSYGEHGQPMEDWLALNRDVEATLEVLRIEQVYKRYGSVGVVKLNGVIDKHLTQFEMDCYGGYDLADFDHALQIAAADPKVQTVVLAINSPGGSVTGVPESAARVAALSRTREVHAFVDGQACSAAYYIASQADHIAAAPSACVGSIGVYMALLDETRALEMEGYRVELIKAGKYKAMGASFKPLTDEERAMLQASVTDLHQDFRSAVRNGRRAATERGGHQTVADSVMEGQWFDGKAALQNRLVDELTGANLDEYVAGLIG
jgi:signal peptide peptidase SppA